MSAVLIPPEIILPHLLPAFEQLAQNWLAQQPKPDQQFTIEQTAHILAVSTDSISSYLALPAAHPRHLRYVATHDSNKGRRIPLSAIQEWQQRNGSDAITEARVAAASKLSPHSRRRSRPTA